MRSYCLIRTPFLCKRGWPGKFHCTCVINYAKYTSKQCMIVNTMRKALEMYAYGGLELHAGTQHNKEKTSKK